MFLAYQAYRAFVYPYFVSPLRDLPGPKDHHFFVGQTIHQFTSGHPEEPFRSWMRKWPEVPLIRYFGFANSDAVLINSLQGYKEVLHTKCYSFVRTTGFRRLIQDIIGIGLVFAEGENHRRQRRALGGMTSLILNLALTQLGLFIVSNIKSYLPMFKEKAAGLAREFEKAIAHNGGLIEEQQADTSPVKDAYSRVTLDVIGIFALGMELKNLDTPTEFVQCYQIVFDPPRSGQILAAINMILPIRWLPFPKANRAFVEANARLREMIGQITQQRIDEMLAGKKDSYVQKYDAPNKDLLTYMIEEKYLAAKDKWTKEDLVEQVMNFVATGHETTASALTWATYALGVHHDITRRLRAEALELLKRSPDPSFTDIENLPYLNNFVRESLRIYCPVNGIPRLAIEDVVIAGTHIPKGTTVIPMPSVISFNPTIWGEDAEEFNPDRWDKLSGLATDPYAWAAFGHGPRSCIGKALAMLNFKTIIMELVTSFDFDAVNKGKVEVVNPAGQLRPQGGMWMKVTKAAETK
ncbi:cytochrome p450 monooxygenase [Coniochaeta ligniaria NRRL 30616]|uniref:Cytochrome p450 monooxygenase n=1 Tax=Coniochaeta ligniaria NRRL 30616 TaxID=1408157 RepID=A0A1J7J6J7_9PEZI|nr:cytochrome p450 monooxygenase [Coniochaeta ligniaria NRRL 30616]